MTPDVVPVLAAAVCIVSILLVPLAGAGLALINAGLSRSRNAAHMMLASLSVTAIAAGVLPAATVEVALVPPSITVT